MFIYLIYIYILKRYLFYYSQIRNRTYLQKGYRKPFQQSNRNKDFQIQDMSF